MVGSSLLEPNPNSSDLNLASQLASAYVDIVQRSTVRTATQEALGLTWLPYYTARLVPNTQLIEVSVVDTDPTRAQAVATELVQQLLRMGPGAEGEAEHQTFIEQQLTQLEAGIVETTAEIERINNELTGMFSARQIQAAREQITALEGKLATLQANYASLIANSNRGATNTIHIFEPANVPEVPMARDLVQNVLVAAVLGFVLAAAAAYLMYYLDNTIQREDDVQTYLAVPTLGLVPTRKGTGDDLLRLGADTAVSNIMGEAYSGLRLNLQAALAGVAPKTLLIGSPMIGDGKTSVVVQLAVDYAQAGYRVLLVDTDLRRPSLHRLFNLRNQSGLSTLLLAEEHDPDGLIQQTPLKGLSVLTSGPLPYNPAHLFSRKDMKMLLARLAETFDLVLLDTPPLTATVDASILATQVDAVLLVIAAGRTKRALSQRVIESLRHLGANVLGVVLNGVPMSQTAYHAHYGYALPRTESSNARHSIFRLPRRGEQEAAADPLHLVNGAGKRSINPLLQFPRRR
jgi:capsular exopolysaccharide synthesis family protein